MILDYNLLQTMCGIHAPSGNEGDMTKFLSDYIKKKSPKWKVKPKVIAGDKFHDNIVLIFGKPKAAIFAHIDSIGFTVRYGKQLVKIGGPVCIDGFELTGEDSFGRQDAILKIKKEKLGATLLEYEAKRDFERGTELTFKPNWREDENFVECCYLDNRLGVFNALKVAETLKNGAIVFGCYEEHSGGSVAFMQNFLQEKYNITQALISDISWISDGVHPGKGPVISLRDSLIPRRKYIEKIITIAKENNCDFQLEVEGSGGSDAKELQMSSNLWDWCFVGAAEKNVHTPNEKVHKKDIEGMIDIYKALMKEL
jgi:putative aminopeptidase FrvX